LIRLLHQLGPDARAALADPHVPCAAGAGALAEAGGLTGTVALNVIDLADHRGDAALLPFVVPMLGAPRPEVARRAADAVLSVTVSVIGPNGRRRPPMEAARHLDRALARAAEGYRRHRAEPVLLALALCAHRPLRHVDAVLAQGDHPATMALRGVAGRLDEPLVRGNLLRWLTSDPLRASVQRWLHALDGAEATAEALADGHLLLAAGRRRALQRVARPLVVCPPAEAVATMPARCQRHVPALLARLEISSTMRRRRLIELVALPSPVARLQVLHHLSSYHASRTAPALQVLCADGDPAVAHRAAQSLAAAGPLAETALEDLAGSAHGGVRRRAAGALAGRRLDAFFAGFGELAPAARRAAARRLLARDAGAFLERLRGLLAGGPAEARLDVLLLARRLRVVEHVFEEVVRLAESTGARIASSAVSALAEAPRCADELTRALDHPSPRVQANAIESLDRVGAPRLDVLVEPWIASGHNRPRANAIKAMIRGGSEPAIDALRRMLTDPRPLHRLSAVWVARTARVAPTALAVRAMGEADPQPEIRARARSAARFLRLSTEPADEEMVTP
jgi:hypothetical protein